MGSSDIVCAGHGRCLTTEFGCVALSDYISSHARRRELDMRLGVSVRRAIYPVLLVRAVMIHKLFSVLGLVVVGHVVRVLLSILTLIIRHLVVTLAIPSMRSRSSDGNVS